MPTNVARRPLRAAALLFISACFASAVCAASAEQTFQTSWRATSDVTELTVREGVVQLSLEDAIAVALGQNLGLKIERFGRASSLFRVFQNKGIYDLNSSGRFSLFDDVQDASSSLDGAATRSTKQQTLNARLDQLVQTGGTVSLDWRNTRTETNSRFSQFNPSFNVGLTWIFNQPLLQGFGRKNTEYQLRLARKDASISLEQLELAIVNTVQQVEDSYWSLVQAREQYKVAQESLALAQELHGMNKIQVDVGTKAPLELVQSEVGVATRQEDIIRTRAAVQDAADLLRQLLNLESDDYWAAEIEPITSPEGGRIEVDLGSALESALAARSEVKQQRLQVEKLELDSRFRRNLRKPSLDVEVRYGLSGLGGDELVFAPGSGPFDPNPRTTTISGGYGDALDQVTKGDFRNWQFALNFGFPIQNRSARAQSSIADLALEQGKSRLEETILGVRTEVRRTSRGVQTAAQQIDSARISRRLAERNLEAQQKRYENGLATSFEVLEIQEDLSQARSREVDAVTNYRRSLVNYYRAIGGLLEQVGIELDDDLELRGLQP